MIKILSALYRSILIFQVDFIVQVFYFDLCGEKKLAQFINLYAEKLLLISVIIFMKFLIPIN